MAFDETGDELYMPGHLDDPAGDDVILVCPLVKLDALEQGTVGLLVVLVLVDFHVGASLNYNVE